MIWVTSDLHFCHNREFLYEPRGFDNIYEMNRKIVENWNAVVDKDDTVYVLGDLILNNNDEGMHLIEQLRGNIKVVLGNHDTDTRIALYNNCYNISSVSYAERLGYNGYHFYLTHYPTLCSPHSEKPLKKKLINLCGHVHTEDRWYDWDKGIIYHVELNAHDNMPVSIDEILNDIKEKANDN